MTHNCVMFKPICYLLTTHSLFIKDEDLQVGNPLVTLTTFTMDNDKEYKLQRVDKHRVISREI